MCVVRQCDCERRQNVTVGHRKAKCDQRKTKCDHRSEEDKMWLSVRGRQNVTVSQGRQLVTQWNACQYHSIIFDRSD